MQPIEIGILIIYLVSLSICSGLIFSLLTSANRDQPSRIFVAVCSGFTVWAGISLVRFVSLAFDTTDLNFVQFSLNLIATAMALSVALYFVFMVRYAEIHNIPVRWLTIVIGVFTIIAVFLIWTNNVMIVRSQAVSEYDVTSIGFVVLAIEIGYMLVSFWLMMNASTDRSALLLRPTFILFIAYIIASFDIWLDNAGLDILLVAIAAGMIGLKILQRQVVNPQVALNRDLQLTNTELQRTINDLAQEKSKTEDLNIELIQANRYKDQFLATMSHELRTPLNSIVGYSELLMTNIYGELGEKQIDRLGRIHRNGKHLTGIIDAILDLNKIDSGRMLLEVGDFSLIETVKTMADEFKPIAEETPVDLQTTLPDDMPIYRGDKKRIEQVLRIILDNSFKFTTEGNVKIVLHYVVVSQGQSETFQLPTIGWLKDGHWAVIELNDTGVGIAPEDQARIFDRFLQIDATRTREYEGIGLGLTIARKLIELHDGLVWVKSYLGQGSTFYIALPFQTVVVKS